LFIHFLIFFLLLFSLFYQTREKLNKNLL